MSKSFLIDEVRNVDIAKAITMLFNEIYPKMTKAEM